jgi:glycosyltransferase involved in cell wall biosynthesis
MGTKPRICVAISTFYPQVGGAETQTLAQCQRLVETGYPTQVITFQHKHTWSPYDKIKGVPVHRVAGTLLGKRDKLPRILQRGLYALAMLVMAITIWHERRSFDILQVCQFSLLVLPLALICYLAKKPMTIVVISAGADKPSKTPETARLLAGPLDPNTPWLRVDGKTWIDGDLYGLQSAGTIIVRATLWLLKRIKAVIIVLSTRTEHYLQKNGFDLPGTQIIPNGVDTTRFQLAPQEDEIDQRIRTVICVSKVRYEKGIDVLLQAWHIVHRHMPEARLIIVGSGPLQPQLELMANALNITQSVEFAGLQSDIPAQLHRGVIGILPSRWEGMPNALLEAMASGLACIATRVSGSEDVIQPGINGLLVESEDYQGMAQALMTLLQSPELVQKYGHAAHTLIEQAYTLEHVLEMYTQLYQKLISSKQNSPIDIITASSCSVIF